MKMIYEGGGGVGVYEVQLEDDVLKPCVFC
jgi:hypothetical protein